MLDKLQVNGVISAAVELFPFKPEDSGFKDFISFYRSETAVFVSDKTELEVMSFQITEIIQCCFISGGNC